MVFHENWYGDTEICELQHAVERVKTLDGLILEIGCWEGKSTVAIADSCYPEPVHAVDTWTGNLDEQKASGEGHSTVPLLQERDVFAEFTANLAGLTAGNVVPHRVDCFEFLAENHDRVKFCHIDASHDYPSVRKTIESLLPMLVEGAVLCGHDFESSNLARQDLQGGVERAVRESLRGACHAGNFWSYQHEPIGNHRRANAGKTNRANSTPNRRPPCRIFDGFMFFNEIELLDIRLHELCDVVHRFVVVEATRTFTNLPKPLYYGSSAEFVGKE